MPAVPPSHRWRDSESLYCRLSAADAKARLQLANCRHQRPDWREVFHRHLFPRDMGRALLLGSAMDKKKRNSETKKMKKKMYTFAGDEGQLALGSSVRLRVCVCVCVYVRFVRI